MKVMHLINDLESGGAEASLYKLIINEKKHEHFVVSLKGLDFYGNSLIGLGIKVYTLNINHIIFSVFKFFKVIKIVQEERPDLIQSWMYHSDLLSSLVSLCNGTKNIFWGIRQAGLSLKDTKLTTLLIAMICRFLSSKIPRKIVCNSKESKDLHIKIGYNPNKFEIIENGVDLNKFYSDNQKNLRIREQLKISTKTFIFGNIATWHEKKDHKNLFEALEIYNNQQHSDWALLLAGKEMNRENSDLVKELTKRKILDNCLLLGERRDLPEIFNSIDVFVLSSRKESFPNVLIESMASCVPCISTNVGAAKRIISDTGWIVPKESPKDLAKALTEVTIQFQDSNKWDERKESCRVRVMKNFDLKFVVDSYQKVWESNVI